MTDWIKYLSKQWYVLASVILIYWISGSFISKYPSPVDEVPQTVKTIKEDESTLNTIQGIKDKRSLLDADSTFSDQEDPFRSSKAKKRIKARKRKKAYSTPARNYKLRGINNSKTAILINSAGRSVFVQVGDQIDSAEVVGITSDKVILKDRGGKFEIRIQE